MSTSKQTFGGQITSSRIVLFYFNSYIHTYKFLLMLLLFISNLDIIVFTNLLFYREFQSLACGVLNQFYTENPDETERMLTRKRPRWRNLTCLEIAYKMKVYSFMSHEACKIPISRVWYGQISPDNSAIQVIKRHNYVQNHAHFITGSLLFCTDKTDAMRLHQNV